MEPRHAIVVGGSRGIGYAVARELLRQGFCVTVTGREASRLAQINDSLTPNLEAVSLDMRDPGAVNTFFASVTPYTMVVISAGVAYCNAVVETSPGDLSELLSTNVMGPHHVLLAGAKHQSGPCHYVLLSSLAALVGFPDQGAYSASKSAVSRLFEAFVGEQADQGVTGTLVLPGRTRTGIETRLLPGSAPLRQPGSFGPLEVGPLAVAIVDHALKRKRTCVVGARNRLFEALTRLVPSLSRRLLFHQSRARA